MNKKLNEEQRAWVELAKREILKLRIKQDELFNNLIDDLLIEDDSDIMWIFDFIHNVGELSNEYYKMIEGVIFE